MDITKKQVEQWCYDNKHTVIDFSNIIVNSLPKESVDIIAESVCNAGLNGANVGTREQEKVFARWLLFDYWDKTENFTLITLAKMYNLKNHATINHALYHLRNDYFTGWRKIVKEKFEAAVNLAHSRLELKNVYKEQ